MTMLSTALESAIGEAILNGDVSALNNPIFNGLGLSQSFNSSNVYASLHNGDCGQTGANEVTVATYVDYARKSISRAKSVSPGSATSLWTRNTGASIFFSNASTIQFVACGVGSSSGATHGGLWDASSGGNFLGGGPLVASGSAWRIGAVINGTLARVYSRSHGLAGGETIVTHNIYNGWVVGVTGAGVGVTKVVAAITDPDFFDVTVAFAGPANAAFVWSVANSIAFADGNVPNIPAGGWNIRFT